MLQYNTMRRSWFVLSLRAALVAVAEVELIWITDLTRYETTIRVTQLKRSASTVVCAHTQLHLLHLHMLLPSPQSSVDAVAAAAADAAASRCFRGCCSCRYGVHLSYFDRRRQRLIEVMSRQSPASDRVASNPGENSSRRKTKQLNYADAKSILICIFVEPGKFFNTVIATFIANKL